MKTDVYKEVTAAIVADLEKGVRPWLKPWSTGTLAGQVCRPRRWNGQAYSGINILSLWSASCAKGYVSPTWMTFRQAQELGGQVRKGERAARVVHAGETRKTETAEDGSETEHEIRFLKAYAVFNVEQIDGLPERYHVAPEPRPDAPQRISHADAFFAATGAEIRHGGTSAHFDLRADVVQMPPLEAFRDAESYYATLAHECTHWTGQASRLAREFGRSMGSATYAREELVAELGAAFLCADLHLTPEPREDHAAYLGSWLKVLKEDSRAIFKAAAAAQKAAEFLHHLQGASDARSAA